MQNHQASENRIANLVSYVECLLREDDVRESYQQHFEEFTGLESLEVFQAFWQILEKGYDPDLVIEEVSRVILAST